MTTDPRVLTTDPVMESASGLGPRRCLMCGRNVGDLHLGTCHSPRMVAARQERRDRPKPRRYRFAGME